MSLLASFIMPGNPIATFSGGIITYAMPSLNNGAAFRFVARNTKDIKSIHVNWASVSAPGTVEARIETSDGSGKPSGTLYDANATKSFTPTAGWQTITFDTLPTTGLTAGAEYYLVLIVTAGGTTQTLNFRGNLGLSPGGTFPLFPLSASDASTRSNFGFITTSAPIGYVTLEDDSLENFGGWITTVTWGTDSIYGADVACGIKVELPVDVYARAYITHGESGISRTGTPAGDLRLRILDSGKTAVSGSTVSVDKDTIASINSRGLFVPLDRVFLEAGTYYIAADSPSSVNSSNAFGIRYGVVNDSGLLSSFGLVHWTTTDQSSSFTITEQATRTSVFGLQVEIDTPSGGGGFSGSPFRNRVFG